MHFAHLRQAIRHRVNKVLKKVAFEKDFLAKILEGDSKLRRSTHDRRARYRCD